MRIPFDPDHLPTVTAVGGTIHGCVFALKALTVAVTAVSTSSGEVLVYTHSVGEVDRLVRDNGDGIDHSHWRFLTVPESAYPAEVQPIVARLRETVHILHPGLTMSAA
jgi:hypothetical protein